MKEKKIPMRKCKGCMEMFPKRDLIRVVRTRLEDGGTEISLDLTGKKNGRGAYLCRNVECFKKAKKSRRIERELECEISEELYEKLLEELSENV